MFDIFTGWLSEFLNNLFPKKPEPVSVPVDNPKPPFKKKPLAWDKEHSDYQEWTDSVYELVSKSKLPDLAPLDAEKIYPQYRESREHRVYFYCQLLSIMSKFESNFDPSCQYEEGFLDAKGKTVVSRGLLQISIESANSYGAYLSDAVELHDVKTNLRCAILIFERWIARDLVVAGGEISAWRGGARYWSVLRDSSKSKPKIMAYMKALSESDPVQKIGTDKIRERIVYHMMKNEGQRETHGKNRSPVIDSILNRVRSSLSNPYCAAAVWCAVDDACKELNLKNPVKPTASSQALWTFTPIKYRKLDHGKKSDAFVLQMRKDKARGHAGILRDNQIHLLTFPTIEANTNGEGSRDGDGWYAKTRSVEGDTSKRFIGFCDFAQWISDYNGVS